jgi:hypothetical protein
MGFGIAALVLQYNPDLFSNRLLAYCVWFVAWAVLRMSRARALNA